MKRYGSQHFLDLKKNK